MLIGVSVTSYLLYHHYRKRKEKPNKGQEMIDKMMADPKLLKELMNQLEKESTM